MPLRQKRRAQRPSRYRRYQPHHPYEATLVSWTKVLAIFTAILAVATGISAYFLWKTEVTLNETLTANDRPWILVRVEPESDLVNDSAGITTVVKLNLTNTGKSPAVNVFFDAKMYPDLTHELIEKQHQACQSIQSRGGRGVGYMVFPNDEIELKSLISIDKATIDEIFQAGRQFKFIRPMILGCVT